MGGTYSYKFFVNKNQITHGTFYVNFPAGISSENINSEMQIQLIGDYLVIHSNNQQRKNLYEIIDMNGRKIKEGTLDGDKIICDFSSGVYLLSIVENNKTFHYKFVK